MGLKWSEPPRTLQEVIVSDTLEQLFKCPHCGTPLIDALIYARSRPGAALDVRCPECLEVWAFVRLPQGLYEKNQLTRADKDQLDDAPNGLALTIASRVARCARCGRELTDPDSIARGLGPVCAKKAGPEGRKGAFWGNTFHGAN